MQKISKWLLLIILFIGFNFLSLYARKERPVSALEIDNLKIHSTHHTLNGKISKDTGFLRYVYNEQAGGYRGGAEEIARSYLKEKAEQFGMDKNIETLKTLITKRTPGGSHVFFDQVINGVPVYGSRVVVTINKKNEVTFIASEYRPSISLKNNSPSISSDKAISIAKDYLNITGKMLGKERAELMLFESKDRGAELAWRVSLPTMQPMGDWEVFVNAIDARIIHVKDRMMYDDGQGMIWDPDPLTTAGVEYGGVYQDNNDNDVTELNAERVSVTLRDLTFEGGVYKLKGPYAKLVDHESPSDNFPELTDPNGFNYTRSQQEFEDVMVYYHIDRSTRRLLALGYSDPAQMEFEADPHGLSGDDNSHYVPSENYVAFGEGGVDDAEDADIIWHEHAHSFQTNLTGGMSYTGETMSLQEGCSDYWAVSYSRYINDYNWGYVFNWDGHNPFWNGRRCDLDWVYPDDYVSGHDGGQIWSSALMDIWADLGRDLTDELFIEAHYIWGYSPGMEDGAEAYIQADENLYDGAHLGVIVEHFDAHGLVDKNDYVPSIEHTPLTDTEDYINDYTVIALIYPGAEPLDENELWVVYGVSALTDSVNMQPTGNPDEYSADIPASGNNIDIYYYITATDSGGGTAYDPTGAPSEYHSFHVGADEENPVIEHSPLGDQAYSRWPAKVRAKVTDNTGVASVVCDYYINEPSNFGNFIMDSVDVDVYEGAFPFDTTQINIGDSIFYHITAADVSPSQNTAVDPASGNHSFQIIETKGSILIINDDPEGKTDIATKKGTVHRDKTSYGKSADRMQRWLDELGYLTEMVSVSTALSTEFSNYDLIISISGSNIDPVSNADYRIKLENWVSDPAHKLFIEGGEIGYDAARTPGYPSFAENVLHTADWAGDQSGNLQLRTGYETHPLITTPNNLPSTFSIDYSKFSDQDSQQPIAPAYIIYGNSDEPDNAGILIYDDNDDNSAAQIVYYAHNFDLMSDTTTAKQLLENTVEYLLVKEAIGAITGNVDLTDDENDGGVSVYLSGLKSDTTFTESDGSYIFSRLEDGEYTVKVHKDGYTTTDSVISGITVNQDTVTGIDFTLDSIISHLVEDFTNKLPASFDISQNYPNPFNPETSFKYQLPKAVEVNLTIFNTAGQKIKTLISGKQQANYYTIKWNGTNESGQKVASGIYIYRFRAGNFVRFHKMIMLK